jgi:hypothetical protein
MRTLNCAFGLFSRGRGATDVLDRNWYNGDARANYSESHNATYGVIDTSLPRS